MRRRIPWPLVRLPSPFALGLAAALATLFAVATTEPLRGQWLGGRMPLQPVSAQSTSGTSDPDTIRVSIGASFDFLNQVSASDLYGDVTVFYPDLWGNLGIEAGVFNGRTTGRADTVDDFRAHAGLPHGTDSVTVIRQTFRRVESRSEDRIGIYGGVLWSRNESVFLTVQAEVLQRDETLVKADTVTATDTLGTVHKDSVSSVEGVPPRPLNRRLIENSSQSFPTTRYQSQFSAGVVIRHRANDVQLYVKPLFGIGAVDNEWVGLWSVQFSVFDFEHGLKLGGDVRGQFTFEDVAVGVYLAKTFSLKKLGDFLGGGG